MAMGTRYPFNFDFSKMDNGRLLHAAAHDLKYYDRDDLCSLIEELADRMEDYIEEAKRERSAGV